MMGYSGYLSSSSHQNDDDEADEAENDDDADDDNNMANWELACDLSNVNDPLANQLDAADARNNPSKSEEMIARDFAKDYDGDQRKLSKNSSQGSGIRDKYTQYDTSRGTYRPS